MKRVSQREGKLYKWQAEDSRQTRYGENIVHTAMEKMILNTNVATDAIWLVTGWIAETIKWYGNHGKREDERENM